jgi:signal peptidase I
MLIARKLARRLLLGLAVAVGVFWLAIFALRATGQLHTYVVPSPSMGPTLTCGDHVAVVRYWFGSPERNDVVAFRASFDPGAFNPGAVFIKRMAAISGDRIEARDGHLLVNSRVVGSYSMRSFGPHTVARGSYLLLGDQREVSDDS